MTGAELIARERQRQIEEKGWTPEHDDEHGQGILALAACCYAAPLRLYIKNNFANGFQISDPFPWKGDQRLRTGSRGHGNVLPDPETYTTEERKDLLIKAGALIAAEIDRLQRHSAT